MTSGPAFHEHNTSSQHFDSVKSRVEADLRCNGPLLSNKAGLLVPSMDPCILLPGGRETLHLTVINTSGALCTLHGVWQLCHVPQVALSDKYGVCSTGHRVDLNPGYQLEFEVTVQSQVCVITAKQ